MAYNLKLDPETHDIIVGVGFELTSGKEYVAQLVKCRLKTLLGEWELNRKLGVPWFQSIMGKHVDKTLIESEIKRVILTTPNVLNIDKFDIVIDIKERKLTITFEARTTYGQIGGSTDL